MSVAIIVDIKKNGDYKLFCSDKQIRYVSAKNIECANPNICEYVIYSVVFTEYNIINTIENIIYKPNDYIKECCYGAILPKLTYDI